MSLAPSDLPHPLVGLAAALAVLGWSPHSVSFPACPRLRLQLVGKLNQDAPSSTARSSSNHCMPAMDGHPMLALHRPCPTHWSQCPCTVPSCGPNHPGSPGSSLPRRMQVKYLVGNLGIPRAEVLWWLKKLEREGAASSAPSSR